MYLKMKKDLKKIDKLIFKNDLIIRFKGKI